ncbi:hypothetical protein LJC15_01030 [Desulfovibrio sp. OttesenSCG-928-G11]|nr:hypothetical protein [Desulfovibrio sp. OttesenSCG-928-G11]
MATQDLSAQAAKGNSPMDEAPAIVSLQCELTSSELARVLVLLELYCRELDRSIEGYKANNGSTALINLSTTMREGTWAIHDKISTAMRNSPAIVSYTTKDGRHIDLDALRVSLEIIADDIDMAEAMTRNDGDIEFADALNAVFFDVDGLIPAEVGEGVQS